MTDSGLSDALQTLLRGMALIALDYRREAALWPKTERAQQVARMLESHAKDLESLAAICTRVTASPQPEPVLAANLATWLKGECERQHKRGNRLAGLIRWHLGLDPDHELMKRLEGIEREFPDDSPASPLRSDIIADIKQAIDEKLLVYGDGLIDKGALYREILNDESCSPDGDGRVERAASSDSLSIRGNLQPRTDGAGSEPADSQPILREEPSDHLVIVGSSDCEGWGPAYDGEPVVREEPSAVVDPPEE